jgi:hypothetical protein
LIDDLLGKSEHQHSGKHGRSTPGGENRHMDGSGLDTLPKWESPKNRFAAAIRTLVAPGDCSDRDPTRDNSIHSFSPKHKSIGCWGYPSNGYPSTWGRRIQAARMKRASPVSPRVSTASSVEDGSGRMPLGV